MKVSQSLVKKGIIKQCMNQADLYNLGIDHLRINLSYIRLNFLDKILDTIDGDNSSEYFLETGDYKLSITKDITSQGQILNINISIDNTSYRIFNYMVYNDKYIKIWKTAGGFTIYSTYFRLVEMEKITYNFFEKFIGKEKEFFKNTISRIDYKIDFFYKEEKTIIPYDEIINPKKGVDNVAYKKGDKQNGWIYGKAKSKAVVVRMYEKIIDSKDKGKLGLYKDYLNFENVYRFEIEFLNKFMFYNGNKFTYNDLEFLLEKVYSYFQLTEKFTNENYLHQYKTSDREITEKDRKYINDATGRNKKLIQNGINPFIKTVKRCKKDGINKNTILDMLEKCNNYCKKILYTNQNKNG